MRALFSSDFFVRFVGGFALGGMAVLSLQPGALNTVIGTVADVARLA